MAVRAPLDRIGDAFVFIDVVKGLGPVKGKRRVRIGAEEHMPGVRVALQLQARVYRRGGREFVGVDVVAAAAVVVVGIPVYIGRQNCDFGLRGGRCHDPGKGKEAARLGAGVQVVQPRARRCFHVLLVSRAGIALGIPFDAALGIVSIRRDLHSCPRSVLVVPADGPDEFFFPAVAPQLQFVCLYRVHAEFGVLAALHPLGPHVPQQAIAEQTEMVGCGERQLQGNPLGAKSGFVEDGGVVSRFQVRVYGAGSPRSHLERISFADKFQQNFWHGDVAFITHITD